RPLPAVGTAEVRLQQHGEEHPRDDRSHLFDARREQLGTRPVLPENAEEYSEGVDRETDGQGAVAEASANVEAWNPLPQRAALLALEGAVLQECQQREGEADEE